MDLPFKWKRIEGYLQMRKRDTEEEIRDKKIKHIFTNRQKLKLISKLNTVDF